MPFKSVYNALKKQNGERFAKAIRNFDAEIFLIPGLKDIVKHAGREAGPILSYLKSLKAKEGKKERAIASNFDLFQLAQQAGYKVIYADTLKKQNIIRSFFEKDEELCTFRDSLRFQHYHIFHFIKQGAEKLNRADFFGKEARDDEYGTSVMSLQVDKVEGHVKICNRYNHTVHNPDNTLDGNPDNIIPGLTIAIEKFLGRKLDVAKTALPEGYLSLNEHIYHYHKELDNIYYGSDFYIQNHQPVEIHKDYQMIVDTFLIDFKKNEIKPILEDKEIQDEVDTSYQIIPLLQEEVASGGKLNRRREGDLEAVYSDDRCILKSRNGMMTYLHLKTPVKSFCPLFVEHPSIEEVYLDQMKEIGNTFASQSFYACPNLRVLSLPHLECLENHSILHLPVLEKLNVSSVQEVGFGCLNYLGEVSEIDLSACTKLGSYTLGRNNQLRLINLNALKVLERESIVENPLLREVLLDSLEKMDQSALSNNPWILQGSLIMRVDHNNVFKYIQEQKKQGYVYE